jgi:hypothetical protein
MSLALLRGAGRAHEEVQGGEAGQCAIAWLGCSGVLINNVPLSSCEGLSQGCDGAPKLLKFCVGVLDCGSCNIFECILRGL